MDEIVVVLNYVRSTPQKHLYKSDEESLVPSLYIRKKAFGTKTPKTIVVTVEAAD